MFSPICQKISTVLSSFVKGRDVNVEDQVVGSPADRLIDEQRAANLRIRQRIKASPRDGIWTWERHLLRVQPARRANSAGIRP